MSRRRRAEKRVVLPDSKYKNIIISKFINSLMYEGKKSIAEGIFYSALENSASKLGVEPVEAFEQVMRNVQPAMEVRSRRVGGATYQVPTNVRPERGMALAIRWTIIAARKRSGRTMNEKLSSEFVEAFGGKGAAVKKREETHKMAESNMAFAHYAFVGTKNNNGQ
jgi:small subunit ribosomal protein S7